MSFRVNCVKATAFAAACMLPLFVTGCAGLASNAGGSGNVTGASVTLAGKTYGAFNPISGATVDLYLAGTAGYGTSSATTGGAKLVAHASSGTDGSFSFSKVAGAENDNSGSTYTCPASGDPLVYLVSRGGNTTGSTGTGQNTAAVLLTLLGPCSTDGGSVTINEATTVGAIFALQQFISITTADIFIGAPNTTSAATGIKNAYSTFLNLVDPQHGVVRTTFTPASTAAGVTMTGTTESAKLITIANVLANCVNQVDNTKTPCTSLMTDVVKPTYQTTNQAVSSYVAPTDTAMATYYLAVYPTQATTALFGLSSGYTPFGAGLGAAPTDWTLAITYTASGTCTNAASANPFNWPKNLAIDSTGQVWVANGATTANALAAVSPSGGLTACVDGTYVAGDKVASVVVDYNDHVWYTEEGTSSSAGNTLWQYKGSGSPIAWPVGTYQPYTVTTTKTGDIIMMAYASGTYIPQVYVDAADATTTAAAIAGSASPSAGRPVDLAVTYYPSTSTTPFLIGPGSSSLYVFAPTGSNPPGIYATYGSTTQKYASVAADNYGIIAGASEAQGSAPYSTWFQTTPIANGSGTLTTTPILSAQFLGGMNSAGGFAVDGVNNYWASLAAPSVAATTSPAAPAIYGFAEIVGGTGSTTTALATALSPAATSTTCTSYTACPVGGSFQRANVGGELLGTAIDPSGNVWATISAGTGSASNGLVEVVGAAAPIVTPLVKSVQ